MRAWILSITLFLTAACYPQAPVKNFTLATYGVTTDTTWQKWQVLSVQKLNVSFRFSPSSIKMILPLRTETMTVLQTFRRKNGAIVYLVKDNPKARAIMVMDGKDLRYIIKTNRNRFFQTCYSNNDL